jgi:hypothetical protein
VINVIVAFIFSFLVYEKTVKLIVAGLLFLFPIIVLIESELVLAIKHILELNKEKFLIVRRNLEFEQKVFKLTLFVNALIFTGFIAYFLLKF